MFQKWQEFREFWSEHSKVSIIFTLIGPFRVKYITFDLKSTGELSLMTLKYHAKFEEKLTWGLKNSMKNLANFLQNTWNKCQNWDFDGILLSKIEVHELKYDRGTMRSDTEEWWKIWRGIDLSVQNWHEGIWQILTAARKNLKYLHFNGLLLTKAYNVCAKKVQSSYVWWHWLVLSKMTLRIWQIFTDW